MPSRDAFSDMLLIVIPTEDTSPSKVLLYVVEALCVAVCLPSSQLGVFQELSHVAHGSTVVKEENR